MGIYPLFETAIFVRLSEPDKDIENCESSFVYLFDNLDTNFIFRWSVTLLMMMLLFSIDNLLCIKWVWWVIESRFYLGPHSDLISGICIHLALNYVPFCPFIYEWFVCIHFAYHSNSRKCLLKSLHKRIQSSILNFCFIATRNTYWAIYPVKIFAWCMKIYIRLFTRCVDYMKIKELKAK